MQWPNSSVTSSVTSGRNARLPDTSYNNRTICTESMDSSELISFPCCSVYHCAFFQFGSENELEVPSVQQRAASVFFALYSCSIYFVFVDYVRSDHRRLLWVKLFRKCQKQGEFFKCNVQPFSHCCSKVQNCLPCHVPTFPSVGPVITAQVPARSVIHRLISFCQLTESGSQYKKENWSSNVKRFTFELRCCFSVVFIGGRQKKKVFLDVVFHL